MKQLTLLPPETQKLETFFEANLRFAGDWRTAAQISYNSSESDKRAVREWASRSTRVISGQRGYKHIANATSEEIHHFVSWMSSQASKMHKRAIAVEDEFRNLQ